MQPIPKEDVATSMLRVKDTPISLSVDMKLLFWALILHLFGKLRDQAEAYIEVSYIWGLCSPWI